MEESTFYHIYEAGWSRVKQDLGSDKRSQINLLDDLPLGEADSVPISKTGKNAQKKPFSLKLAKIFALVGVAILAIYFIPGILANTELSKSEADKLSEAASAASGRALPRFDPSLSKTNRLTIPSIGVDTDIEESTYENYESALKKGVWRVSDFGEPDLKGAPVILAAHRFGYLAWTNSYRHYNSFYNLPKVKEGDVITIAWEQRLYIYGVYKTENGEEIGDYSADLILYTCENLNGPERIFVYAKLI